jgi:hypothetical protein
MHVAVFCFSLFVGQSFVKVMKNHVDVDLCTPPSREFLRGSCASCGILLPRVFFNAAFVQIISIAFVRCWCHSMMLLSLKISAIYIYF